MKNLIEEIKQLQPYNEQERQDQQHFIRLLKEAKTDLFKRESEPYHITSSAWVVNEEHTKILMAYHLIYDSYSWVGGHCDGDHDTLRVALKEATEETGVKHFKVMDQHLLSVEILPVKEHYKKGNFVAAHQHLNVTYLLVADEKEQVHSKEDENSDVLWIESAKLDEYVSEKKMLDIYHKLNQKSGMKR